MKTKLQKLFLAALTLAASSQKLGINLIRVAILVIFVWIGGLKFWNYEAEGIVPFVANSPFMSFFYDKPAPEYKEYKLKEGEFDEAKHRWHVENNTYGFSRGLGILIMAIGILTFLGIFFPKIGLAGAALAVIMTVGTLSFLVTTPEVWVPDLGSGEHGFPLLTGAGRLVIKDTAILAGAINIGCIPTKTLIHSAKLADTSASWEQKRAYYRQSVARKEEVTSFLRQKNYRNLSDNPNITVYTGTGSFVGPDVVEVRMAEETIQLQAQQIFVNTGAETIIPPIGGVKDNPKVYTSTSIMELAELPKHLVIVGGGYIGLEFASMYASFGSQVTVLESYSELIAREDRDIAASVQEVLEKKGITFCLNARVQSVEGTVVVYQDAVTGKILQLDADAILLATGRRPNTAGLNLPEAGVEVNERGAIIVNEHLQTTNPNIRAIGDVKGGLQFTYISLDDYRILREDLFGAGERKVSDREPVSYSVFIDPPLSRIGMSETEAREKGLNIKVNKLPVSAIPRARTLGNTDGLFKVIVDADTDKIVGCTLFGPESSEVINLVAMAMKMRQEYTFLRDFIFTHPSMSEALNDLMNL